MKYRIEQLEPKLAEGTYVAPGAVLIGDVTLEEGASVWFNAVVRADEAPIVIGAGSNIQDGCVLHADPFTPLRIGKGVTVGHLAMLHGCTVGDGSLVGIGAVVLNGARIGKNCLIGARALVTEGVEIPDGSLVLGSPGKVVRQLLEDELSSLPMSAQHYLHRGEWYEENLEKV